MANTIHSLSWVEKNSKGLRVLVLGIFDYVAIVSAIWSATMMRNMWIDTSVFVVRDVYVFLWVPLLYMIGLGTARLYSRLDPFWITIERIFYVSLYNTGILVVLLYVGHVGQMTSRLAVGLFAIIVFFFLLFFRYGAKRLMEKVPCLQVPLLLLGAGKTASVFLESIKREGGLGYRIIGVLDDRPNLGRKWRRYRRLGSFADAEAVIQTMRVSHVCIAAPGMDRPALVDLVYRIQPLVHHVTVIPDLLDMAMGSLEAESLFNEKLVLLRLRNNLSRRMNRYLKWSFDMVCTCIGTIVLLPVLLGIAAWVYWDSPGPVLFAHERIGRSGKPFRCYKFRSMCMDAKERLEDVLATDPKARKEWEQTFKLKRDPRVTRSGSFLRKTSLDELPQIFNVLKGEMSLVGPRPIIQEEVSRYGKYIADYYLVRPGITGLWQVSGRSDTGYTERVQMDSWYVRNWSVWLDLMLLWRTLWVVLKRKGAY